MTKLLKIFDPELARRPMRVMAFMSGSGTNVRKVIERQNNVIKEKGYSPFNVAGIFSDRSDGKCLGQSIAWEFGIPYFSYDIRRFHTLRNAKRTVKTEQGMELRLQYDNFARTILKALEIDLIVLGGYMSYTTLKKAVNVHPADLTITDSDKKRKYVGDEAVFDAICDGCRELRSTTIWIDEGVDTGPILMVSEPVKVEIPDDMNIAELKRDLKVEPIKEIAAKNQERLKELGDWKILPLTIQLISQGRFALDLDKQIYFDGKQVPDGLRPDRLKDIVMQ